MSSASADRRPCEGREARSLRTKAGAAAKHWGRDSARAQAARREYRVFALAEYVRQTIADVGPLTAAHRAALAAAVEEAR